MKTLTRNEFLTLMESNPGKKFVFQENWNNDLLNSDLFDSDIHITSGDLKCPTHGAFCIDSNTSCFLKEYNWDLKSDYTDADMFNVFDENDIREVIRLLSSVIDL